MCGIVGIAASSPIKERELLIEMRDTLQHRGPDDAGVWWSSDFRVGLAHRRLSIIDLSAAGHQPMFDQNAQICITFNGEIYNFISIRQQLQKLGHFFRTGTDTEVIIEAYREWGVDCVKHFNGMFAFCIFDVANRRLFLARDRAGEKPLFYYHHAGKFVFASELRALMADPEFKREIDFDSLNYYLTYGYTASDKSMLKGVQRLLQAQAMIYDLDRDKLHLWQYWHLPDPCPDLNASPEELMDELECLLLESTTLRLTADVPVGIMLSGGIDSSIITALAASSSSKPVKTFTISFGGGGIFDEAKYARLVAEHFSTDHTELVVSRQDANVLLDIACKYDEPIADSSIIPTYLVSKLIRPHATVALGGDGGDELFGGYIHYAWIQRAELLRRILPGVVRSLISRAACHMPIGLKGRNHLVGLGNGLGQTLAHFDMIFDHTSRNQLLSPQLGTAERASWMSPETYKAELSSQIATPLQRATINDFRTYLVDDILTKVDRSSMLNSLEVRAPWLDHRIIEFAFARVPDQLKVKSNEKKILSRSLAKRLLPKELDLTRKQGFSIPIAKWFKGGWGDVIESTLADIDEDIFNKRFVQRLIREQRMGLNNTKRLFTLTMFELWRREYLN